MRRPPQLWEQQLSRTTAILGAGISSSGDATAIVQPQPPPGAGGGTEPAPVAPAPGGFIAPSQPTLFKQVQAINVLWDGLNSAGDLWPYDTSWVEIHMGTTAGFTAGTATLKGRLTRPGIYSVGGLTSGVTYYFKLRGADPAGNVTSTSSEVSSTTGSASSSEIISISADKVTAGTVTGLYISGGTIAGGYLSGGTISGGFITGGTIESARFQTSGGSSRVAVKDNIPLPFTTGDGIEFFGGSTSKAQLAFNNSINSLMVYCDNVGFTNYNNTGTGSVEVLGDFNVDGTATATTMRPTGGVIVFQGYRTTNVAGDVIMRLQSNVTNTGEAKFEVDADGDVKSRTNSYAGFSDARYKENIELARDYTNDLREVDVVTFNWQGSDQKLLGVTAQQIQPIFPSMVAEDEDGTLSVRYSVFVPMLITAVQSLADQVDDLRARIEALEA
jgi:hypothetical protein